jgi:hypothetical protein
MLLMFIKGCAHATKSSTAQQRETKHKACMRLHTRRNMMVPNCQTATGPIRAGMVKFKCGDCHNIAHDLNNCL